MARAARSPNRDIDHGVAHADDLARGRCGFPTRHGRLRAQLGAAVGQACAGQIETRIGARMVEIVGVFVTAGDREHARARDVRDAVGRQERGARIGDQRRACPRHSHAAFHRRQQQNPAGGGHASASASPPCAE